MKDKYAVLRHSNFFFVLLSLVPTSENYKFSQHENFRNSRANYVRIISKCFDIFLTENVLRIWIANSLKGMPPDMQIII